MIYIDWLTLSCYGDCKSSGNTVIEILEGKKSQVFGVLGEVFYKGEKYARIAHSPHSKVLKSDLIQITIENKRLYEADIFDIIENIAKDCGFSISSISRIDICHDFNRFCNDLEPKEFINSFLSGKYQKNGRGKFQIIGEQSPDGNNYQYLRFGKHGSEKSVYLYNKTLEMKDNFKPHIFERWQLNDLDVEKVWRLEVSLHMSKPYVLELETGEIVKVDFEYIKDFNKLKHLFLVTCKQNFAFKIDDGTKNKTRKKDLELLPEQFPNKKLLRIFDTQQNSRVDRIFLKRLNNEHIEASQTDSTQTENFVINHALELVKNHFIEKYALENWYLAKCQEVGTERFKDDRVNTFFKAYLPKKTRHKDLVFAKLMTRLTNQNRLENVANV